MFHLEWSPYSDLATMVDEQKETKETECDDNERMKRLVFAAAVELWIKESVCSIFYPSSFTDRSS